MSSKVLAAALTLALAVAGGQTEAAQGRGRVMRFKGMDRNNDGKITRAEWNGNDRSFAVHDWNGDGVLSADEVRPGARRAERQPRDRDFDTPDREYEFDDWTARGFNGLDHNRDNRITADEWHFDREGFRRADHNRDGVIARSEFLNEDAHGEDDDVEDRFIDLDQNRDNRISRAEWHGTPARFDALDDNRDGMLTRAEVVGTEPPPDLFTSVDVNRDGAIARDEWHWTRGSFDRLDANRDGRLTRPEFADTAGPTRSQANQTGRDRGQTEGRSAGREDRERNQGWDLDGQRELQQADSGYEARFGPRAEYQAGYRDGFRGGYREGWGNR